MVGPGRHLASLRHWLQVYFLRLMEALKAKAAVKIACDVENL